MGDDLAAGAVRKIAEDGCLGWHPWDVPSAKVSAAAPQVSVDGPVLTAFSTCTITRVETAFVQVSVDPKRWCRHINGEPLTEAEWRALADELGRKLNAEIFKIDSDEDDDEGGI